LLFNFTSNIYVKDQELERREMLNFFFNDRKINLRSETDKILIYKI